MPVFVFYRQADGLIVGWRESDFPGDPAAEAASRGEGILYLPVLHPPEPTSIARVVDGMLVETPRPVTPNPDHEIIQQIQDSTTVADLKIAILRFAARLGVTGQ